MPCRPQMGQEKVWLTQRHTIRCFGSLYLLSGTMPSLETNHPCDRNSANQFCSSTESDHGGHQCPCKTKMGQEKVWSTKRLTILCFGSLNSVEIGLHWKLTTHTTEIVQSNAVLSDQGGHQCPVGPRWARKRCGTPKGRPYSVVLGGNRPELETNHPYDRNPATQCCFGTKSD